MSRLGRSFDMLLDEGVNTLAVFTVVANLDGLTMIAQMNASLLSGVIARDVEYSSGA